MAGDWFHEMHTPHVGIELELGQRLFKGQSPYQMIEVVETLEFGRMLVVDGAIMFTARDEFVYHEMIAHPPLFAHGNPERVLIVGGGDGGSIREVLKHDAVHSITLVEIDGMVIDTCRKYFPDLTAGMDHAKVEVVIRDGFAFLDDHQGAFDVILVDSTDPVPLISESKTGPAEKLFTPRFFEKLHTALKSGGIAVFQSENPFFAAPILSTMHSDLRRTFRVVELYLANIPTYPAGLWSFTFCSDDVDPHLFRHTSAPPFVADLRYYHQKMFRAALTLPNYVRRFLAH
ncbi:MAG: polyamine aminopropyltransferase [SAR324 cluster bacterium]|nr:polyamine aminopropyltransferase [SAR324 cluster bacterium]